MRSSDESQIRHDRNMTRLAPEREPAEGVRNAWTCDGKFFLAACEDRGGGNVYVRFRWKARPRENPARPRRALLTETQLSACCLVFEVIQSVAAIKTPDAMKVR